MDNKLASLLEVELASPQERRQLLQLAHERRWGPAIMLVGWLHLAAFSVCHYLTVVQEYNDAAGYLLVWIGELCGMWLIFRLVGGPRRADQPVRRLEQLVRRVWIAYFVLAFNLGSLNTLRGHHMFEFFPAMASLASFALILMSIVLSWRFFLAVLVMFASGLLMAGEFIYIYAIFAVVWWLVLNGIGLAIWCSRPARTPEATPSPHTMPGSLRQPPHRAVR
jgi:hypothetical protein